MQLDNCQTMKMVPMLNHEQRFLAPNLTLPTRHEAGRYQTATNHERQRRELPELKWVVRVNRR